ncbi:MAG: L-threonylcarbamoyladenylate synthase [Candidatus Bathyarchaeota archaeon]|nr:L-threonylcarbamoyladenylate synthase [Candidatus Bathyarchaeota archaeon]
MPKIVRVNPEKPDPKTVDLATKIIKEGGIIIYPTDTVYGIGTNALKPQIILKIFKIKRRPLNEALPIAVSGLNMANELAFIPKNARELIRRFWPGALTIILRKKPIVPREATGGGNCVGLRAPNHPVPIAIIKKCDLPLIATSANKHGEPNPVTAGEALRQVGENVDLCLDAGRTEIQRPSTVLDLTKSPPVVLRIGPISVGAIKKVLGEVRVQPIS